MSAVAAAGVAGTCEVEARREDTEVAESECSISCHGDGRREISLATTGVVGTGGGRGLSHFAIVGASTDMGGVMATGDMMPARWEGRCLSFPWYGRSAGSAVA